MNPLIIIPARGGSQRLLRKNLLPYHKKPLFVVTATHWNLPEGRVVVSTDDDEIASVAKLHGLEVHRRPLVDEHQTIPEASALVAEDLGWTGPVLTVQPTVQPLPSLSHILTQDVPSILSKPGEHDIWLAGQRTSRDSIDQLLGVYYWPEGTVGNPPEKSVRVHPWQSPFDIDTPLDLVIASLNTQYNILAVSAPPTTWNGTGHERRQQELGLLLQHYGNLDEIPDMILLDSGDSHIMDISHLREQNWGPVIVTFEDKGPGALHADATINSHVANPYFPGNEYKGSDYAFIRSEFLGLQWEETSTNAKWVLVAFGGTDAKDLQSRVGQVIKSYGYTPKFPSEFATIAEAMLSCRMTISGAGQLVSEAAYLGVPTITMAATLRESAHTHLGPDHGNLYLGYAGAVSNKRILQAISTVASDSYLRREMWEKGRAAVDGKGAQRIIHILEGLLI